MVGALIMAPTENRCVQSASPVCEAACTLTLVYVQVTEFLQKKLQNKVLGNVIFWLSFCIVGQPICALLYYHDYLLEHSPQDLPGPALAGPVV